MMSFLSKLFSKNQPKQRIRVCVECGMPIAEHKQWCSILRGQQEMDRKAQAASAREVAAAYRGRRQRRSRLNMPANI